MCFVIGAGRTKGHSIWCVVRIYLKALSDRAILIMSAWCKEWWWVYLSNHRAPLFLVRLGWTKLKSGQSQPVQSKVRGIKHNTEKVTTGLSVINLKLSLSGLVHSECRRISLWVDSFLIVNPNHWGQQDELKWVFNLQSPSEPVLVISRADVENSLLLQFCVRTRCIKFWMWDLIAGATSLYTGVSTWFLRRNKKPSEYHITLARRASDIKS